MGGGQTRHGLSKTFAHFSHFSHSLSKTLEDSWVFELMKPPRLYKDLLCTDQLACEASSFTIESRQPLQYSILTTVAINEWPAIAFSKWQHSELGTLNYHKGHALLRFVLNLSESLQ